MKPSKFYKVTVTMKTGFVYSYTCIGRLLEGLKKSSQGDWTEKLEVVEITEEEYEKRNEVIFKEEPRLKTTIKTTEKKTPKFSNLEDFFQTEGSSDTPKRRKKT